MNDKTSIERLTRIETNLENITNNVEKLSDGVAEFTKVINDHVKDDIKEHSDIKTLIQKNTDWKNRIMWTAGGIIGSVVLFYNLLLLFA